MAYYGSKIFSRVVTSTFFRDIQVVGQENIPTDGPLLLYGNHNNQFIDPLLILSHVPRRVSFIAAAKVYFLWSISNFFFFHQLQSMRKPIIGHIGRMMGGIPVERPQDLARRGTGVIQKATKDIIHGFQTKFTQECKQGDLIIIQEVQMDLIILEIIDDFQLRVRMEQPIDITNKPYKIQPKIDQSQMFESVWKALQKSQCIGIFPEGGSHDQTKLLPLKPGICIMALGAIQKYQTKVYLQPVGLNYFKGHKFRSKVIIEFGVPYEVNSEIIKMYSTDKRSAISNLLNEIQQNLKLVTLQSPSYSELSAAMTVRTLYLPDNVRLNPQQNLELIRRFTAGYSKFKDHPEVKEALMEVKLYNYKLKALGVQDYQVLKMQKRPLKDIWQIAFQLIMTVLSLGFALPGYMMSFPIAVILDSLSERERKKALASSKVKLSGKDVVASYKVLASLIVVPIAVFMYSALFYIAIKKYNFFNTDRHFLYSLVFLFSWPFYITFMIRSNDGLVRRARKLKTLILFYLYESKYRKLKQSREVLKEKVRKLVEMWGEEVVKDFQNKRIVRIDSGKKINDIDINDVFQSLTELGI